ncbi:MAG: hypothetical protein ACO3DQ_05970, partial [Cephaloticoccus sp.]
MHCHAGVSLLSCGHLMRWKYPGLALLAVAYAVALALVLLRTTDEQTDERATIRISQWQLEGGVREGIDAVIRRY